MRPSIDPEPSPEFLMKLFTGVFAFVVLGWATSTARCETLLEFAGVMFEHLGPALGGSVGSAIVVLTIIYGSIMIISAIPGRIQLFREFGP